MGLGPGCSARATIDRLQDCGEPATIGDMGTHTIGAELRRLRVARGMTQAQVAESIGCDRTTVARHETGAQLPSIGILRRYAKTYRIKLATLLDRLEAA